jgi:hypothetical protein
MIFLLAVQVKCIWRTILLSSLWPHYYKKVADPWCKREQKMLIFWVKEIFYTFHVTSQESSEKSSVSFDSSTIWKLYWRYNNAVCPGQCHHYNLIGTLSNPSFTLMLSHFTLKLLTKLSVQQEWSVTDQHKWHMHRIEVITNLHVILHITTQFLLVGAY